MLGLSGSFEAGAGAQRTRDRERVARLTAFFCAVIQRRADRKAAAYWQKHVDVMRLRPASPRNALRCAPSMNRSHTERHLQLTKSLEANPFVVVEGSDYVFNSGTADLGEMAKRLPPDVASFYSQVEKIQLRWAYDDDAIEVDYIDSDVDFVEGEFNLVQRGKFIRSLTKGVSLDGYGLDLEDGLKGALFPIDVLDGEYSVCVHLGHPDEMYFLDLDESEVHRLPVDFSTYLTRGYGSRFFYGWQKAIFLESAAHRQRLDHYSKQLFPS